MTALIKDRNTPLRDGGFLNRPVKGGVRIFSGALVVQGADANAKPGVTATGLVALGRADQGIDNTLGNDGDATIRIRRHGLFCFDNLATDLVPASQIGKPCYVVDDATVAATDGSTAGNPGTPATRSVAGIVADVDDGGVWVKFA